jgi:Bacterial PH domain
MAVKAPAFRSPTAALAWVVWLLFAAGNWIDLAVQGRDHLSVVAAAVLLLVTGIAYVTAQRPRIIADDAGITIRNPLRDHRIGWAGVTTVDLADLLRVHCDWQTPAEPGQPAREHHKVISAWAVHHSRRRQFAAETKGGRGSRPRRSSFGLPSGGPVDVPPAATGGAEAQMIVRILSDRAAAAQADGRLEPLTSTWSRRAIAALVLPALILLVVILL